MKKFLLLALLSLGTLASAPAQQAFIFGPAGQSYVSGGDGGAPIAPNFVPVVVYKTGIDLKTNGTTDIFTVPTGQNFVCTGAYLEPTAVTGGAAVAFNFKIIESGGSAAMTTNAAAGSANPNGVKLF